MLPRMSRSPRRPCPHCKRPVATPGGRFARHDPPHEGYRALLVSCEGSLRQAPAFGRQDELFAPEDVAASGTDSQAAAAEQDTLFS